MRSGTARMKSDTATTGPGASASALVTYGTFGSSAGCRRLYSSVCSASRRSSVQDVADHTTADTPQSWASSSWARSAQPMHVPEARICALGAPSPIDGAGEYRYRPFSRPGTSTLAGSAGCRIGSLLDVRREAMFLGGL